MAVKINMQFDGDPAPVPIYVHVTNDRSDHVTGDGGFSLVGYLSADVCERAKKAHAAVRKATLVLTDLAARHAASQEALRVAAAAENEDETLRLRKETADLDHSASIAAKELRAAMVEASKAEFKPKWRQDGIGMSPELRAKVIDDNGKIDVPKLYAHLMKPGEPLAGGEAC